MSSSAKIYLVTGASRGIGFGLVSTIVSKQPNAIVYATARDPVKATALQGLASKFPNQVKVTKYVTSDAEGTRALAQEIADTHGRVDVVVANAGIFSHEGAAVDTPADALREHLEINAIAVLMLFQAFAPLLQKSASPKFIPITSSSGSLTSYIDAPTLFLAYGVSKAALNYIARKIHFENAWLTCFPLAPGMVETDMVKEVIALDSTGMLASIQPTYSITPEVAGGLLLNVIESSTRETHGGEFINNDGSKISW